MHIKSALHVRDHSKVVGKEHHLLEFITQYTNQYTGEAYELTVDRIAHRLDVTPQWVGQLRRRLVESGKLIVKQSRGRRPNVYIIPYEHCPACQGMNPKVEFGVEDSLEDLDPKVDPDQPPSELQTRDLPTPKWGPANPKVEEAQPQTRDLPTPKWGPANPKVGGASRPALAHIEPQKEVKEKEKKDRPTPNFVFSLAETAPPVLDKPEMRNPFWCEAHAYCHSERLPDHRPDCARERAYLSPPAPATPLQCVGRPGRHEGKRACPYHGLTHFFERE